MVFNGTIYELVLMEDVMSRINPLVIILLIILCVLIILMICRCYRHIKYSII